MTTEQKRLRQLYEAPDGWQLVPKDPPYHDMLTAGRDVWIGIEREAVNGVIHSRAEVLRRVWAAMLAAAPHAPDVAQPR